MGLVTPGSFRNSLSSGSVSPLYLFFGEEELLIDEAVETLLDIVVDESVRSFNFEQFNAPDIDLRDVAERAMAYPMMAERRVILLRNVDKRLNARSSNDGFISYLEAPAETTVLVMTASSSRFLARGKAKKPYDKIFDNGTAVQFKKLYDRDLPGWIIERLKSKGRKIEQDAVALFVTYVGGSLRILDNEIEKLITFAEDRRSISVDDVRLVVGASREWNVFELQKAIGAKKLDLAIEIAERMVRAGEPVQVILTMLVRYFTMLWRLLEIRARSRDRGDMAKQLGVPSFFIDEYLEATTRYGLPGIRTAFESLLAVDIEIKTGRNDPSLLMQLLVASIVRNEPLHLSQEASA